jgi:hypothetical protein
MAIFHISTVSMVTAEIPYLPHGDIVVNRSRSAESCCVLPLAFILFQAPHLSIIQLQD